MKVLLAALILVPSLAMAQEPESPMTPQQSQDYIGILFSDRIQQLIVSDKLKIQVEELKRQLDRAKIHDEQVDLYWKKYTGLDKK